MVSAARAQITGGQRVANGRCRQRVGFVPEGCPTVKGGTLNVVQRGAERFGQQMMVAIPVSPVVQRDQKEIGPFEIGQHGLAVAAPGHRVAKGRREAVEDRRLAQKIAHCLGLLLQHLFDQVIDDVVVAAAEGGDEVGTVRTTLASCRRLQSQTGKLETGHPAFGPPFQCGDIIGGEGQLHGLVEEIAVSASLRAQIAGTDLGYLIAHAPTGERQRRILTRDQDKVQIGRCVVEPELNGLMDRRCLNPMVIIKHHDQGPAVVDPADFVEQRGCENSVAWKAGLLRVDNVQFLPNPGRFCESKPADR